MIPGKIPRVILGRFLEEIIQLTKRAKPRAKLYPIEETGAEVSNKILQETLK